MCVFVSLRGVAMGVVPAILVHAVPQPLFFLSFQTSWKTAAVFPFFPPGLPIIFSLLLGKPCRLRWPATQIRGQDAFQHNMKKG